MGDLGCIQTTAVPQLGSNHLAVSRVIKQGALPSVMYAGARSRTRRAARGARAATVSPRPATSPAKVRARQQNELLRHRVVDNSSCKDSKHPVGSSAADRTLATLAPLMHAGTAWMCGKGPAPPPPPQLDKFDIVRAPPPPPVAVRPECQVGTYIGMQMKIHAAAAWFRRFQCRAYRWYTCEEARQFSLDLGAAGAVGAGAVGAPCYSTIGSGSGRLSRHGDWRQGPCACRCCFS